MFNAGPNVQNYRRSYFRLAQLLAVCFLVSSCATYQKNQSSARDSIRNKNFTQAVEQLRERALKESDDQLVYLLDYAIALQLSGQFEESNKALQKAEEIADIQDYHSISRLAGSILLMEELVQYKGEDFEKVMINAMGAINYLELGNLENALVQVRRLNNKLYKYKYEAKRNYEQNSFAFYMSGVIWEADKKWDEAYISYKNAYEVAPDIPLLKYDLIRLAKRAQRPEDYKKWRDMYPDVKWDAHWDNKNYGELIFVYQQGWGPQKYPRPESHRFPMLVPVRSQTVKAELQVAPHSETVAAVPVRAAAGAKDVAAIANPPSPLATEPVYNVEQVAIKTMDDQFAELVAKRVAGMVAKEVVADQVRQKNELLGMAVWAALHATDRADLRQWSTLPETLQVVRVFLPAGKYSAKALGINSAGSPSGEESPERQIEIRAQKKTFISWRSTQ